MPANSELLKSPTQRDGGRYERLAADFLQSQGLILLSQNWQQPKVGEIDLVLLHPGRTWDTLVFAEVRKRKNLGYGDAAMSVTRGKQRKLIKVAQYFLQHNSNYLNYECRFDVIAFNQLRHAGRHTGCKDDCLPEWIQGAFLASAW